MNKKVYSKCSHGIKHTNTYQMTTLIVKHSPAVQYHQSFLITKTKSPHNNDKKFNLKSSNCVYTQKNKINKKRNTQNIQREFLSLQIFCRTFLSGMHIKK